MNSSFAIGKTKFNYLKRLIALAKENEVKTLADFESFIIESRAIHISKLKKTKIKGKDAYIQYINSKEWTIRRQSYIQIYGMGCQICIEKRGTQLHHMSYRRLGNEPDKDLLFLCSSCHHDIHFGVTNIHTTKPKQLIENYKWTRRKYDLNDNYSLLKLLRRGEQKPTRRKPSAILHLDRPTDGNNYI